MKLLKNEGTKQKITILLVLVLTINFIIPNYSQAKVDQSLIDPVITFVTWLGDGTIKILQSIFIGEEAVIEDYADYRQRINDQNLTGNGLWGILGYGFGQWDWFAELQGNIDKLINGDDGYEGPIVMVKYSVAAILSNEIPTFDINFFNPNSKLAPENMKDAVTCVAVLIQEYANCTDIKIDENTGEVIVERRTTY